MFRFGALVPLYAPAPVIKPATMKLWFKIIVCGGIVSVSAAALSYTWQTWRAYQLETRAEEFCKIYVGDKMTDLDDADKMFAQRQCINMFFGRVPVNDGGN